MTTQKREGANAKLRREDVLTIRRRAAAGDSQGELCRVYGVSIVTIGRIVRFETWGWLTEEQPDAEAPGEWRRADLSAPLTADQEAQARAVLEKVTGEASVEDSTPLVAPTTDEPKG